MNARDVLSALNDGVSPTEVAQAFMSTRRDTPVETFCAELLEVALALDDTMGPWTLEPPGPMSTLRVVPEVLSAFSMEWKKGRPAGAGWRHEMRTVVLILSGKYRTARSETLEDEIGSKLASFIRAHQPALPPAGGRKGKNKTVAVEIEEDTAS